MNDRAVYVEALGKSFGERTALDGLDLAVPRGCVMGLVGKNGAGKTTLLRCVMGLLRPDAGFARVFGQDQRDAGLMDRARVAYVPQEAQLFGRLALEQHAGLLARFYPRFERRLVAELADRLELDPRQATGAMSAGSRRKAAVVLALASGADLLVLDEPAAGLDPLARRDLYDLLIDRLGDGGAVSVLLSTHLVGDLERLADRVAVVDAGRTLRVGTPDTFTDPAAGGYQRVQVVFPGDAPADFRLQGAPETVLAGPVALGVVHLEPDAAAALARLEADPALRVTRFPLTLEEVFVELVDPDGARRARVRGPADAGGAFAGVFDDASDPATRSQP